MIASRKGHADCVKILLDGGEDPDYQNVTGWTALMNAAIRGRKNCMKMLLKSGANPNLIK